MHIYLHIYDVIVIAAEPPAVGNTVGYTGTPFTSDNSNTTPYKTVSSGFSQNTITVPATSATVDTTTLALATDTDIAIATTSTTAFNY